MLADLSRTASKWLTFYSNYLEEWWDNISYSQYMVLMLLGLAFGWLLLKSSVKNAS